MKLNEKVIAISRKVILIAPAIFVSSTPGALVWILGMFFIISCRLFVFIQAKLRFSLLRLN